MEPALRKKIPAALAPYLRVGTCSWKFDAWKGLYYDAARDYRPDDYLADYARHLDSVEIDQWFWSLFPGGIRMPDRKTARAYAASVPDNFIFTVKAPNAITLTHFYSRQARAHADYSGRPNNRFLDPGLLEQFLDLISPFGKKLGPVMFQFEYLNKKKMPSRDAFLDRLHEFFERAPRGVQYSIETRNPNYLSAPFFEFLRAHRLGFVFLSGYYMPPIREVFAKHGAATADHGIVRLHGGDRLAIEGATGETWDRIVAPKPDEIRAAADIARANAEKKVRTFININNHFEGSAPLSVERFLVELAGP